MSIHPYLPQSVRLFSMPPQDKVYMQQLWTVMNDLERGFISVNQAIEQINNIQTLPTGIAKGDIIAFNGVTWVIVTVGADGEALVGDSLAASGVSYAAVTALPAGANTDIQFNNAGVFGGNGSLTTTPAKITITKDRSGVLGALYITRGDAVQQYIVLEEDPTAPDFVYLTFKSSGGNAIAMGMEASGGVPAKYVFTDPSAAILAWIDVVTGDLGVTNLAGVGVRMVTASATGILATAAVPVGLTDGDKGDITVSASGATWTIDNDVVTFGKMQDINTDRILGRDTAAAGNIEELTLGSEIIITGGAIQAPFKEYHICAITSWNPLDGTTVFFNGTGNVVNTGAANLKNIILPACTIVGVDIIWNATGAAGSNESIPLQIRFNDTTDIAVATVSDTAAVKRFTNTGLSQAMNGTTDFVCFKIVCPTWATNPTAVGFQGFIRYRLP